MAKITKNTIRACGREYEILQEGVLKLDKFIETLKMHGADTTAIKVNILEDMNNENNLYLYVHFDNCYLAHFDILLTNDFKTFITIKNMQHKNNCARYICQENIPRFTSEFRKIARKYLDKKKGIPKNTYLFQHPRDDFEHKQNFIIVYIYYYDFLYHICFVKVRPVH